MPLIRMTENPMTYPLTSYRLPVAAGLAALLAFSALPAAAQTSPGLTPITEGQNRVTGQIVADFGSRRAAGATGVDVYTINALKVADLMTMSGTIQRTPEKALSYSVKFDVNNPKDRTKVAKDVAILRGDVVIDESGRYLPANGKLRIDIVKGQKTSAPFSGVLKGREVTRWWEIKEQLAKAQKSVTKAYSRVVDGKTITIQVKNPDPLGFDGLVLAAGPFSYLPDTTVRGSLDYDYELGNWLTDNNGIELTYKVGDAAQIDKITGSIRFAEEEGSAQIDGKAVPYTGYYDYSLRFNESQVKNDEAFFDGENSETEVDAFFSTEDQTKPGIYGRVYFQDVEDNCKMAKDAEGKEACVGPTLSVITYDLKAVGLNYAQLANWMKIEQLVIGPFTDE
ncbi:MAG: hypothetical protein U1E49_03940 [Hyphomicrobiaceae bacterium]